MKTYHICRICDKKIIGGDVVIDERLVKQYAHQLCVTKKRIEDTPKPKARLFGSLRVLYGK